MALLSHLLVRIGDTARPIRRFFQYLWRMLRFATDRASQLAHFREADSTHYRWQTEDGRFASSERELLLSAGLPTEGSLLEIGCGEGGNLFHLGARAGWVGIDFAHRKLTHASARFPDSAFACCDAGNLPFGSGSFDSVLIRDVLHHVPDRQQVVAEAARVLRPGGVLAVIEPNRNNPLIVAQAVAIREERAVLRSTATRMRSELETAGFTGTDVKYAQPLPLARILLHPRLGLGKLGQNSAVAKWLDAADYLARRTLPQSAWMYLVGRGDKPLE
jgi:SAM-dependent methyltransferase